MVDMPSAASPHIREEILVRNVQELQSQLQAAYKRIAELNEQVNQLKSSK
jgi:hypothetical protein